MSHFCENPVNLGRFDLCTVDIDTGLVAAVTGEYTFAFNFLGKFQYFTKQYTAGSDLDVPNSYFSISNGNFVYEVKVTDPDGVEIGCFTFKTVSSC